MKGWQILLTGVLPFLVSNICFYVISFMLYGNTWHEEKSLFYWSLFFYLIPAYCLVILPWYCVQYLMLHHYNKHAFYYGTLAISIIQPIVVAMLLKVRIGSTEFFSMISPILITGIVTAMICMMFFYKKETPIT